MNHHESFALSSTIHIWVNSMIPIRDVSRLRRAPSDGASSFNGDDDDDQDDDRIAHRKTRTRDDGNRDVCVSSARVGTRIHEGRECSGR